MARLRRGSREPRPFLMRSRPILGALGSTNERAMYVFDPTSLSAQVDECA